MDELSRVVRNHPLIDNHAHNLLNEGDQGTKHASHDLLSIVSEAQGLALGDSASSLPNSRARLQLSKLYGCEASDWDAIVSARGRWIEQSSSEDVYKEYFRGTHTLLIDDGLGGSNIHPYKWHDQWTRGRTRRLVRIEAVAEDIIRVLAPQIGYPGDIFDIRDKRNICSHLKKRFLEAIDACITDPDVVGFKSVICYRSGLAINADAVEDPSQEAEAMMKCMALLAEDSSAKLSDKVLNESFLALTMSAIRKSRMANGRKLPIQFHTGLGDNDMLLELSSPSLMQPFIRRWPDIQIVLLHCAYPYTREAGYLATVYENVYLDLGLVFPMVSKAGQETVLRQALELVPTHKLLWSTDGHWYGETFWLANLQFREALEVILTESVQNKTLNASNATKAAKDILFNNSNRLYALDINESEADAMSSNLNSGSSKPTLVTAKDTRLASILKLQEIESQIPSLAFIYVLWLDLMGTIRSRILPIKQFRKVIETDGNIGISRGNTGTLQNDTFTPAVNTTGKINVHIDLDSLRPTHIQDTLNAPSTNGAPRRSATVLSSWCDDEGNGIPVCARSRLEHILDQIEQEFDLKATIGFEIEVTFLRRSDETASYTPYTQNHAYSTLTPEQWSGLHLLRGIYDGLAQMGIEAEQFHAEAGLGQYEIVLPPLPAVAAISMLLQARLLIQQIAHLCGLRATFHPQPLPGIGTAAHAHVSLGPNVDERAEMSFWGGVLRRLRPLCALTMPQEVSYKRVVDGCWTGGTWVAWGSQNRETPLRRVEGGRWAVRCLDGFGNMYLALAGVFGAGLLGLRSNGGMESQDCLPVPNNLTDDERASLGITERMPFHLQEAIKELEVDEELAAVVGNELITDYLSMKNVEQKMLNEMPEDERNAWLIERY